MGDLVVGKAEEYQMLLICFRTEQMSIAQLRRHMDEDPAFAEFVRQELGLGSGERRR